MLADNLLKYRCRQNPCLKFASCRFFEPPIHLSLSRIRMQQKKRSWSLRGGVEEHQQHKTWPSGSSSKNIKTPSTKNHKIRYFFRDDAPRNSAAKEVADFSALPFDILLKIAAPFSVSNLWAASAACRSWRDALRPLREAMVLVRWGKRFKHGTGGVHRNVQKALHSFLKAASRGSSAAMVDAGLIYWEMGMRDDAVGFYRKSADLRDPTGECNLGLSFLHAEPPDPVEAVKWFYRAAFAGHVRAQYSLALCLQKGRGVDCDLQEAAKWYLKAAEGGNARAMYNTALCFSSGEGFTCNYQQARRWMRKAAEAGHSKALFEHGFNLFSEGNKTTSLVYLELALRAGEEAARPLKNVLLQQLPAALQKQALLTANRWTASHKNQ